MMLFILAGISIAISMIFAAMGDTWGWFLWWVLAIGFGVIGAIRING